MTAYSEKTFEIVKTSIKSAVFIDEKARGVYEYDNLNDDVLEERLSVSIYNNFKNIGISLAVHKFQLEDRMNENLLNYLFDNRDLVLLDWKLQGNEGEEYSLELLSRIISSNHINFCCIYTTEPNTDNIFYNILSYFSGVNKATLDAIKNQFIDFEDSVNEIRKSYNFIDYNAGSNGRHIAGLVQEKFNFNELQDLCGGNIDRKEALFLLMLAFESYFKSPKANKKPTLISVESMSLVINNTIVCILNKENAITEEATNIIKSLAEKIEKSKNSFTQLLGIEMRNIFNSEGSFVDENLFKISKESLFAHRKYIKETNNGNDIPFKTLIKQVLLEHAYIKLRTAKLSLLNDDFLESQHDAVADLEDDQVALINTFYNSVSVNGLNTDSQPNLNFGDIFKDKRTSEYYLCITALCDCLRPDKIKQNFYFVKGQKIDTVLANTLGDSAFISYVGQDEAISWIALEPDSRIEINKEGKSEHEIELERLKIMNKLLTTHKYRPVYIKPHSFNVKNPKIINYAIEIRRIESIEVANVTEDNGDIAFNEINYLTTLRPNYTQRIANHAFTHPIRVGVDFVKI